ncbi:N-acetylglucosaminyl-phosphatidylinositol de-N-acetylase [Camellia lanceoleosa]|uniref:N-acetylglucosaminyl-phosphatidylinositol de-N-acetylase n=1 Tax=Camellia lanceoleosa TaxID=1840588 RepID=A0ACC0IDD3_9ERIC|nr:N-acetylglucosaminyl-phosphatidylinositol de-N-acetylase [Camellia lanceoleosa]
MGNIRKEELYQASAVLKVPPQQVKILDHPDLQDGFGKVWSCDLLARIIEEEILSHAIDLIITFDNYGVSGHCNHRDVNQGIRKLLRATAERDHEAWELVPQAFCAVLQLYLREYTEEDQPVGAWDGDTLDKEVTNDLWSTSRSSP